MHIKKFTIGLLGTFVAVGFALVALVGLVGFVGGSNLAIAQQGQSGPYTDTGISQSIICRGDRDFETTGISIWNQFMDPYDFVEYWKDITVRYFNNSCLYEDIYGLVKRIDGARTALRKAFYVCGDTERISLTYYKLETELYFLRNYVDFKKAKDIEGNTIVSFFMVPMDNEWLDFTGNIYPRDEQLSLFRLFTDKYKNKLDSYSGCKDSSIENFVQRVNDDIDYLENIVKESGESLKKSSKKLGESASGLFKSISSGEYFKNIVDVRINGLPCPIIDYATETDPEKKQQKGEECLTGIDEISKALREAADFGDGISFEQLQKSIADVEQKASRLRIDADAMSEYEYLYLEGSDDMTRRMTAKLKSLKNVIDETFPHLNQTMRCAGDVPKAQCKNK